MLFLGILNTLRTWNYFDLPDSVYGYANTGGFGIDGYISSFMGASWVHPDKLYFCVAGDLAFFYDMNVLGNRHVAAGHYGNKSRQLVRHYAEDLGYEYLSAENKEDYLRQLDRFLAPGLTDRPMLFEVFTDSRDESDAIRIMNNLNVSTKGVLKEAMKSVVGEKGKEMIKKVMGR